MALLARHDLLHRNQDVDDIRRIVPTASEPGLSGVVLGAGLDRADLRPPRHFERLGTVKQVCAGHGVEIIPIIFSARYGKSVMARDRSLAAVRIMPMCLATGEAAGAGAAIAVQDEVSPRDVRVSRLHAVLREGGAILDRPR